MANDFNPNDLALVIERMSESMRSAFEMLAKSQEDLQQIRQTLTMAPQEPQGESQSAPVKEVEIQSIAAPQAAETMPELVVEKSRPVEPEMPSVPPPVPVMPQPDDMPVAPAPAKADAVPEQAIPPKAMEIDIPRQPVIVAEDQPLEVENSAPVPAAIAPDPSPAVVPHSDTPPTAEDAASVEMESPDLEIPDTVPVSPPTVETSSPDTFRPQVTEPEPPQPLAPAEIQSVPLPPHDNAMAPPFQEFEPIEAEYLTAQLGTEADQFLPLLNEEFEDPEVMAGTSYQQNRTERRFRENSVQATEELTRLAIDHDYRIERVIDALRSRR